MVRYYIVIHITLTLTLTVTLILQFFVLSLVLILYFFVETRIIDMELHFPFLYFSLDDILLLIGCILTQQRIVFMSSSYSLLTPIVEVCIPSWYCCIISINSVPKVSMSGSYLRSSAPVSDKLRKVCLINT